ncbi:uncharacterized protein LOC111281586 [Durio zibethinus]|uniref:Uncharacterized protein LOC111281586 n=1 Tax=Durio zibethinus TaxID=66656 RepID=A0A6P5XBP1_DURZI|nr:uncharacterized protein LOC111281586 [Durio zibethinus]
MVYYTTWLIAKLDLIKYIFKKPSLSRRITRWLVMLSEYDIVYVSQKAIKGNVLFKFLADRATNDYEPMKLDFSDKELMTILELEKDNDEEEIWRMYFDRATNAIGYGIGAVLISPREHYYPVIARLNFNYTNNVAKYNACVMGLHATLHKKVKTLRVFRDSALVIYQLKGTFEAKKIIEEVHNDACDAHANWHIMARQVIREMDVIGPITPKASNGNRFIFVMIDYFTKWVKATSFITVTRSVV